MSRRRLTPREQAEICAIGIRLWRRRKAAGLTRKALGALAGVDMRTIQYWEQGERGPAAHLLARVARALGVPVTVLLEGE